MAESYLPPIVAVTITQNHLPSSPSTALNVNFKYPLHQSSYQMHTSKALGDHGLKQGSVACGCVRLAGYPPSTSCQILGMGVGIL